MKLIRGMKDLPYEDSLRKFWLFSLEKIKLHGDLIASIQYLTVAYKGRQRGLFIRNCSDRTRSNG